MAEELTRRYAPVSVPRARQSRGLTRLEQQATLRLARVQAEGMVQTEKVHELDRLASEAMTGQAMLHRWGATLAAGDPFLADEMKFFTDIAKLGKGEIIADTVTSFCREGRSSW